MSCPEYLDTLTEAALGGEAGLRLRAHLAACSQCRSELDRLRALTGAIDRSVAAMVTADPSPGFAARIRARVAEESASRSAWWRGWAPAVAGGMAALALVVWLLWSASAVQPPAPAQQMAGPSQGAQKTPPEKIEPPLQKSGEAPPKEMANGVPPRVRVRGQRERVFGQGASQPPPLPEVLVTGDEWKQVVKLYALSQKRQADSVALTAHTFTPPEDKVQPFSIEFIQIKPLETSKPEGGR